MININLAKANKTSILTNAPKKGPAQPAHLHTSLIRAFGTQLLDKNPKLL